MIKADTVVQSGQRLYGRFATTPHLVNPLDQFKGPRRAWEGFRLKQWAGWTLLHPDLFSSMIIQDAKYLANSEIYVFERSTGSLTQQSAAVRGGSTRFPLSLLNSRLTLATPRYAIGYDFTRRNIRIRLEVGAHGGVQAIRGELVLDRTGACPALVVSSRLPSGTLYTNKIAFPAAGHLHVGGQEYRFDPGRDLAILDQHASRLPYRTDWTWGTFAFRDKKGIIGANFVRRPELEGQEEESCLWTPTQAEPLGQIGFVPDFDGPMSPWRVYSADGRLEVRFTPQGRKRVAQNFGPVGLDYFQAFGTYNGVIHGADADYPVNEVHGVLEVMRARL